MHVCLALDIMHALAIDWATITFPLFYLPVDIQIIPTGSSEPLNLILFILLFELVI